MSLTVSSSSVSPSSASSRHARVAVLAVAVAVTVPGLLAGTASAKGGGGGTPPQIIAFPSRDFVSLNAYPVGDATTTTWAHGSGSTPSVATGDVPLSGTLDINHVSAPCWTPLLTAPTTNMHAGDTISVTDSMAAGSRSMVVSDVNVEQAATPGGTTVVVRGTASNGTGGQVTAGNLQVRIVAKKDTFLVNGRRDLRAVLGGQKDGTLTYDGSAGTSFTATFTLPAGDTADVTRAVGAQTRGIVQNDPLNPTAITISEHHVIGDGVIPGNARGCPPV